MYDPQSGWVSITTNLYFDRVHRYEKKDLKPEDFADDEWNKEDDELFADPTDIFDADEPILELNSIPHKGSETNFYSQESRSSSQLSDISDSGGDKRIENNNDIPDDQLRRETEEKSHLQFNKRDRDSSIQPSDIVTKQYCQGQVADPTPDSRQYTCIKDKTTTSVNLMCSVSTTPSVFKSHIHIVTVLANLNARYDDSGSDEPLFLEEAIVSPHWKNFEKAMYIEFKSLIENDTWKYKNAPSDRAILTGCWVFNIQKDRWSKILKFKA